MGNGDKGTEKKDKKRYLPVTTEPGAAAGFEAPEVGEAEAEAADEAAGASRVAGISGVMCTVHFAFGEASRDDLKETMLRKRRRCYAKGCS